MTNINLQWRLLEELEDALTAVEDCYIVEALKKIEAAKKTAEYILGISENEEEEDKKIDILERAHDLLVEYRKYSHLIWDIRITKENNEVVKKISELIEENKENEDR